MSARVPGSVVLAIRTAWALVVVIGLTVLLMAAFHTAVLASWARRHAGAKEAYANGGRAGLERAGIVPPAFWPVAATMFLVAAMLVWVLTVFFREGHRWGQLGLTALVVVGIFASALLGFRLNPPPVFVVLAVVSLGLEGLLAAALWHKDTVGYLSRDWLDGA